MEGSLPLIVQPCEALRPFVERYAIYHTVDALSSRVLPGIGLVMGFQYTGWMERVQGGSRQRLHRSGITGILGSAATFSYSPGTHTLLVYFREAGGAAFLPGPVHELFGASISLEQFMLRSELVLLEERLEEAASDADRISVVEGFLLNRLRPHPLDPLVVAALDLIHTSKGSIRIAELAHRLHTSRSPLERRFRARVGTTPKQYAGIVRMQHVLRSHGPGTKLLDTALDAGFYDQAHFIKVFRDHTGEAPQHYFSTLEE